MSEQTGHRASAAIVVLTVATALAGLALTIVAWADLAAQDSYPNAAGTLAGVMYAALGALIVRRARNSVGWILEGIGLGLALLSFTSAYAVVGIVTHPALPGAKLVGGISEGIFAATAISLGFMLFVFPTGRLPSEHWRPVVRIGVVAAAFTVFGMVVVPLHATLPAPGGVSLVYANPWRISSSALSTALVITVWIVVLTVALAFLSLVTRYRSGDPEQRLQIKWVAFTAAAALSLNLGAIVTLVACTCDQSAFALALLLVSAFVILIGVPAALTIAILKYRLYDIDVIINRALVYGLLAAGLTIVYVGVVVGVGALVGRRESPALTIAAAVAVALVFQPFRRYARGLANRLVYGDRATPYQVLSDFAARMANTFGLEDVLRQMASIIADGTGATRVDVWLLTGGELRSVAAWPVDAPVPDPLTLVNSGDVPAFDGTTRMVEVRHHDEPLGALSIEKPRSEPLTPTEEKLLEDLASQAGLVLRNVRLTADLRNSIEELRASRRRLVEAQDLERRRIERNLHDGAQQQLVALTVQLGLIERAADDPERVRQMATRLQEATREALDDLRDLARGVYPPLLADKGLAAALQTQAGRAAVPTTVQADGIRRYPQEVEAAVYFCALEALQNVAKYAEATTATIRVMQEGRDLVIEIEDDGRGFDASGAGYGTGLQGMADRLDAIGGVLNVASTPGEGTVVRGSIPLDDGMAARSTAKAGNGRE